MLNIKGKTPEDLEYEQAVISGVLPDSSLAGYRDGIRILTRLTTLGALVILVLTGLLVMLTAHGYPEDRYYAMSFDERRMPLSGLHDPSTNVNALLGWVSQAATQVLTFGFNDINQRFTASRIYFTDIGWESFFRAMQKSSLLKNILGQQQIMTAIAKGVPTIQYSGLRKGEYVWDIVVPVILTVRIGGETKTASPRLIVTVRRVPTSENPSGLGIEQWYLY